MTKRRTLILAFLVFLCMGAIGQRELDSLRKVVANSSDTNRVNALMILAKKEARTDTTKIRKMYDDIINTSLKLKFQKGIVQGYCQKARLLLTTQNDVTAYACLVGVLKHIDTIKPNMDHHKFLITAAAIYGNSGQVEKTVQCYLKSLKISDALNDKRGIASSYYGLAYANIHLGHFDKAEQYGLKALDIYKGLNDQTGIMNMNSNLGSIYLSKSLKSKKQNEFDKAAKYLNDAIAAGEKIGDIGTTSVCYTNLAILFAENKKYNIALPYSRKALELKKRMGDKHGVAITMNTISGIFGYQKQLDSAEKYSFEALKITNEINAPELRAYCYADLSSFYEQKKDYEKALAYHKRLKILNDSLVTTEKSKALADIEEKYESEKKDKEIALFGEKEKVKDQEITKQRIINYAVGGGLFMFLILSVFIFKQYSQKKKAHNLLEQQNEIINEKNRNITDSINYAKVIQNAILLGEDELSALFPDTFIVFKPKDIVSGDFYWFAEKNGKKLIAAVDCTGHGVPGAFMSMIGTSFLNEIVNERGVTEPAMILGLLRDKIKKALKQKGEIGDSKDGMDIALLSFDEKFSSVEFSGANNGLCLIRSGTNEIEEISPDKRPIGYYIGKGLPFTNHKIDLKKGDALYIFTDGYADQFGGPKGKKFKYKQLMELILANHTKQAQQQKQVFLDTIETWKGTAEQTDDICLIGFRV